MNVHGIHHVTAIAGDPQKNLRFYTGVLGMRLVKKSVNQDAPDTYHLFYADAVGTPGTDLTFFSWPNMAPARAGVGQVMEVLLSIPQGSMDFWKDRLAKLDVSFGLVEERFGEPTLPFRDPDGLPLALVEARGARPCVPWTESAVPAEHQLRGMSGVRLWERQLAPTEGALVGLLGFRHAGDEEGWRRFAVEDGAPGQVLDVRALPDDRRGSWGQGGVHHVAWRTTDVAEELTLRARIESAGLQPTPLIDRFWFESVYFREPGGVLFELATDGPGFARDESPEHLGERLVLPPWLEPRRSLIEDSLPPLDTARART